MSRIQEILSKAERDGTARRTRALSDEGNIAPAVTIPQARTQTPVYEPAVAPAPHVWNPATAPAAPAPSFEAPAERPAPPAPATGMLDPHLVAALAPHSLAAEQYRSLRTRIKRAENGRAVRAIIVTSPAKGDGKSLTAANLALTMAQEYQQRVLLLDADLRRPTVHRLLAINDGPGLSDVLTGAVDVNQALVSLPGHHLTVLPAGTPPNHPAELLGSAAMRRLLDTLRTRFDRILIDMPPVAPLADLHILAPMADGVLMIVRAGVTPKPAIERALSGLDMSKVLGLVLNETGGNATDRETYEGYGYIAG
jgi:capsular exopolysaccharide synthesis family protein